jgi:hypothetical protein
MGTLSLSYEERWLKKGGCCEEKSFFCWKLMVCGLIFMEILSGVVFHGVVSLERSHLLDLKLAIKSCASLSGGGMLALMKKGRPWNTDMSFVS